MIDSPDYWRFVAALIFVLALIVAIAWLMRRFGMGGPRGTPIGRKRRLAVVDVLVLDARRRLVLVSRDGVEHLLLLGAQGETVVERASETPEAGFRTHLDQVHTADRSV